MLLLESIFYVFAAFTIGAALMVITQNNPVRCVLFLVFTFFTSSVLWILLSAEFLALILVLVYVGAVMTLFLFVVMMLNIDKTVSSSHFFKYLPVILIVTALLVGLLMKAVPENWYKLDNDTSIMTQVQREAGTVSPKQLFSVVGLSKQSNAEAIGMVLYTDYIFAFELAAVLLLVAIIAAITLAHRKVVRGKRQNITEQIMTRREERVTLISMHPEK